MRNFSVPISRRKMLGLSVRAAEALSMAACYAPLLAGPQARRFKIGACDWSIGKMDDPGSFELASQIG